jgi:hypothetical protein
MLGAFPASEAFACNAVDFRITYFEVAHEAISIQAIARGLPWHSNSGHAMLRNATRNSQLGSRL